MARILIISKKLNPKIETGIILNRLHSIFKLTHQSTLMNVQITGIIIIDSQKISNSREWCNCDCFLIRYN